MAFGSNLYFCHNVIEAKGKDGDAAAVFDPGKEVKLFWACFSFSLLNFDCDKSSLRRARDNVRNPFLAIGEKDGIAFSDCASCGVVLEDDILFYTKIINYLFLNILFRGVIHTPIILCSRDVVSVGRRSILKLL